MNVRALVIGIVVLSLTIPLVSSADGGFAASFSPKAGNEWWVEVFIDANEPLAGVEARADGGAWHALTLRSWGAWAGSFHVPDGSIVTFRATSTDGDTDLSDGYVWPGATPASTGEAGSFDATFDPKAGNEWWVEVFIGANEPISAVAAQADGGTWHTLTLRSWGAWAGSFHVPDGSIVTFRATSTDGDIDVSDGYVWPSATPATPDDGGGGEEPPLGSFDATFRPKAGNEWWVEAFIDANQKVSGVAAQVDGGTWHSLTLRSWGAWAGSFHVPDGSIVTFRATSGTGETDLSQGYVWPSATPSGGDGGTTGPGTLDVAFAARAGNAWWVETYVVANATITTVEGRADGGSWHTLTERSWGTWAGSFHAPSGSTVEFRATAADGSSDTSVGFTWPQADAVGAGDAWPREGSYMRQDTWYDPPGGYAENGYKTSVYHDGTWWTHHVWTEEYDGTTTTEESFRTDRCPRYGPTAGVAVGDDILITSACRPYDDNATVREQTVDPVHVDGKSIEAAVWHASDRDPCNCLEWTVYWDREIGLVTYANLAGRGASGFELMDTNAPLTSA